MTLEERLSRIAELLEAGRAVNWSLGDEAADMVREYGREIIGKIAELARCSSERIRQLIRVAVAFSEEYRYSDVEWSIYRECYNAARRIDREPVDVLKHALKLEMSLADIAAMGKEALWGNKAKLSKTCEWCGSKIRIEADGGLAGTRINCPVCAEDGQKHLVGVLLESDD